MRLSKEAVFLPARCVLRRGLMRRTAEACYCLQSFSPRARQARSLGRGRRRSSSLGLKCTRALSLYGEWAAMNNPYLKALFSFNGQERSSGFFINEKAKPGDLGRVEYN
jgi:hypothetical protein